LSLLDSHDRLRGRTFAFRMDL